MRCTHCSRSVRPIVAFDIDGTLGDYHGHFRAFAEQYLQRGLPWIYPYNPETPSLVPVTSWSSDQEFSDYLGIEKEEYRRIKLAYRQGGLKRSMPVYHDMVRVVQESHALGYEIWLTTTRPWQSHNNIHPDTKFWLERANLDGIYHHMLFDEDKYQILANAVDPGRVLAVVDDLPEQWDAAVVAFGYDVPLLKATTYNKWFSSNHLKANACNAAMLSAQLYLRSQEWHKTHALV